MSRLATWRAPPLHIGLLYNNPSAAYLNELLVGVLEQSSQAGMSDRPGKVRCP
jgi:hypothetical protein